MWNYNIYRFFAMHFCETCNHFGRLIVAPSVWICSSFFNVLGLWYHLIVCLETVSPGLTQDCPVNGGSH